jgi:adenylate kinase family enzyme
MQRAMITGGLGFGKSTLARILGARTGLPIHHMAKIHWKPGWKQREVSERELMFHTIENGESWICEGGFSKKHMTIGRRRPIR